MLERFSACLRRTSFGWGDGIAAAACCYMCQVKLAFDFVIPPIFLQSPALYCFLIPLSFLPSKQPYQNSEADFWLGWYPRPRCSSFVVLRIPSAFRGPLRSRIISMAMKSMSWYQRDMVDLLLSNRYGIPMTKPRPTMAISIIGLFKKLMGSTVLAAISTPFMTIGGKCSFFVIVLVTHILVSRRRKRVHPAV